MDPLTPDEWEAVLRRRAEGIEAADRFDRQRAWRCLARMWAWYLLGAGLVLLSWRLTGDGAFVAFYGGLFIGNMGALYTWYLTYFWNRDPGA